jgi:hypothetical protein
VSIVGAVDQVCRYFGGDYDETAHAYLTTTVPGLGAVRRARPRRTNRDDLFSGMACERYGSTMLVHAPSWEERREAVAGATSGLKLVRFEMVLHLYLYSTAEWAEDAQDAFYELIDALRGHIHADRTLGSGGFEARLTDGSPDPRGLQAGEGDGALPLRGELEHIETHQNVTRGYGLIGFDVDQFIRA